MIRFAQPYLLLLLLIPVAYLALYYIKRFLKPSVIGYSDTQLLAKSKITFRIIIYRALPVLTAIALSLTIIAAARPQAGHGQQQVFTEGIDIMLALVLAFSLEYFAVNRKDIFRDE